MKVHFTTLGCPKNQVDSELMLGMLTEAGHQIVEAAEAADCLVVNTCAFIDRAREESVNTILELAQLKERGRARALIVTGCLTQRYGIEIQTEIPEINAILGTSELHRIVELVNQADGRQAWVSQAPPGYLYDAQTPRRMARRISSSPCWTGMSRYGTTRARRHLAMSRSVTWAGWRYIGRIHGMGVSDRASSRSPMSPLPERSRP